MSKAYIKQDRHDRHEVTIKLLDAGLDAPVKLEIRTNADHGQLQANPGYGALQYALDVGHEVTVVIED